MMRWLALALLTACTSFDAVPRDTCGNGILEPGEDCDSPAASCVRCAVTCQAAMDCPTADYTCGVDGFCHAPGGALGPPVAAGSFLVDDYTITDVDRDRIGDVVGISKTSIVVRHGDANAALAKTESQITPSQTGPASFGDLDGDGSLDLTIATPDGLVSYASPYGTLSPLDVRSTIVDPMGNPVDIRMGFPITQLGLGVFVVTGGQVLFAVLDFSSLNSIVAATPCQALAPDQFSPALVDVYKVAKSAGDATIDMVVAMTTVGGGKLCVLAVHKDNLFAGATITNITPLNPPALTKKPVLADLDNDTDHCPDVVTTEGGAHALRHWSGSLLGGHCVLQLSVNNNGDALPAISNAPANSDAIGRAAIDPPQLGAVPDALVLSDSIWAFGGGNWGQIYQSTRKLASVTNADVDGDGLVDIVLSAAGSDDLDVLYRASAAVAVYQLYRVDTASVVTSVAIADFDGDGFNDIEYTESLTDHQRMMVAYGTSDRVLPPIEVATFTGIVSVAPVSITPNDPLFLISDLLVLQPPDMPGGAPALTFLSGSPQRIMIPYFDPRDDSEKGSVFRAVIAGNFAPTPGGGAPHNDLVAMTSSGSATGAAQLRAWLVPGTASGLDGTKSGGLTVNGATDCSLGGGSGFCYEEGTYLAWPVSSSQDIVLGVDREQPAHAGYVDPRTATATTLTASNAPALAQAIPAGNVVRALYPADVDGDGKLDLVAVFQPAGAGAGALLVCQVDATGMPQQCSDLEATIKTAQPMTTACFDAAPGHFGYRDPTTATTPGSDLVALCHDDGATLYRIHHESDGYHADVLTHSTSPLASLRVGDVNGDGIDDVIAVSGERGAQSLLVFPQCSSRTLATCQLGAGGSP